MDKKEEGNFQQLISYWQQNSIGGLVVVNASHFLDRCIITFGNYAVVFDEVIELVSSVRELPTTLVQQEITLANGHAMVNLVAQSGTYLIRCRKVRLFDHVLRARLI